jgi:hypothetical protein
VPAAGVRLAGAEEPERTGVGFVEGELDFEEDPDGAMGRLELGLGVAVRVGEAGRVVDLDELEPVELLLPLDEEPLAGREEELRVAVPDFELLEELLLPLDEEPLAGREEEPRVLLPDFELLEELLLPLDEEPLAGREEEPRVLLPDFELLEELLLPLDEEPLAGREEELRVLLPDFELLEELLLLLEEEGREVPLELPRVDEEEERLSGRAELRCRFSCPSKPWSET